MGYNSHIMLILLIVIFLVLITVSAISPIHSELSMFELERRSEMGDREAKRILVREELLCDIISLQNVVVALLLVVFVSLSLNIFGWLAGVIVSLVIAIEYGAIANIGFIKQWSRYIYKNIEGLLLRLVPKAPYFFRLIRNASIDNNKNNQRLGSSAELRRLVDLSDNILTSDEKNLIVHGLSFSDQIVKTIMTPREKINYIDKSEFLGPLALNDLHKAGHSRLPVIDSDVDHVVGILHLQNLLTLGIKKSTTAEKAMEVGVNYIHEDQTLNHALSAFLRTHHHLFIVINKSRETVGLLTLNDVIQQMIGRKIIDEFDSHDNLVAVAMRK